VELRPVSATASIGKSQGIHMTTFLGILGFLKTRLVLDYNNDFLRIEMCQKARPF